jgi:uncharacterized protein with HEPN domain
MSDKDLIVEVLKNVAWSIDQISKRFQAISTSDDLLLDDDGMEKLDSICMQLINVGEGLKYLDKLTDAKLLSKYPEIDWKKAKGLRDIITHHYFDIDAETIHIVCSEHIPKMKTVIEKIIDDVQDKGLDILTS